MDMAGKVIYNAGLKNQQAVLSVNTAGLKNGSYLLVLKLTSGQAVYKKFMINR
jgi:hypothetical protein